jgi:hypothetical protein
MACDQNEVVSIVDKDFVILYKYTSYTRSVVEGSAYINTKMDKELIVVPTQCEPSGGATKIAARTKEWSSES